MTPETSRDHSRPSRIFTALFLAAGLGVHVWLGLEAIRAQSPTFDEPVHLTAGYVYWRTRDYRFLGLEHAPLSAMTAALPLLFMDPVLPTDDPLWTRARWGWANVVNEYAFANRFLYHNAAGLTADSMIDAGRRVVLAASCLFLLALFLAARSLMGPLAAGGAFAAGALCPTFLAHGTVVTPDFLFMAFYFLFFYAFYRWERDDRSYRWPVLAGTFLGLAFCSRFSAVAVAPVLVLWLIGRRGNFPLRANECLFFVLAAIATTAAVYQGVGLPVFWQGVPFALTRAGMGQPSFLLGRHSSEGWWYYFPVTVLLKTPLPVLILLAWTLVLQSRDRVRLPWIFYLPPAVYFLIACTSPLQIGHRYIMPIYPFIFLILGVGVRRLWTSLASRAAVLALGAWLAASTVSARPYFLAYFHEAAGGPDSGHEYLTDSNVDWGQGLRALKAYLDERGVRQIYLSYFGTADPNAYGFRYASVAPLTLPGFPDQDVDLSREPRALLVVSATNYQSTYYPDRALFRWLHSRRPAAILAGSLLVFDITGDADAFLEVARMFRWMGKEAAARGAEDMAHAAGG